MAIETGDKGAAASEETPKFVTAEEVHGAVTERLKRYEAKLEAREKALETRFSELKDLISSSKPAAPAEPAAKPDEAALKAAKEVEQRFKTRLDQMEAERKEEREKALRQEERAELSKALVSVGISEAPRIKSATALLYLEDKRIGRDAEGKIIFKSTDKYGDPKEDDLETGIKEWATTEEGKTFIPAKQVAGSGNSAGRRPVPGVKSGKQSSEGAMNVVFDALRNRLGG